MSYFWLLNEGCQKFAVDSKNDFLIFQRVGLGDSNACKTYVKGLYKLCIYNFVSGHTS